MDEEIKKPEESGFINLAEGALDTGEEYLKGVAKGGASLVSLAGQLGGWLMDRPASISNFFVTNDKTDFFQKGSDKLSNYLDQYKNFVDESDKIKSSFGETGVGKLTLGIAGGIGEYLTPGLGYINLGGKALKLGSAAGTFLKGLTKGGKAEAWLLKGLKNGTITEEKFAQFLAENGIKEKVGAAKLASVTKNITTKGNKIVDAGVKQGVGLTDDVAKVADDIPTGTQTALDTAATTATTAAKPTTSIGKLSVEQVNLIKEVDALNKTLAAAGDTTKLTPEVIKALKDLSSKLGSKFNESDINKILDSAKFFKGIGDKIDSNFWSKYTKKGIVGTSKGIGYTSLGFLAEQFDKSGVDYNKNKPQDYGLPDVTVPFKRDSDGEVYEITLAGDGTASFVSKQDGRIKKFNSLEEASEDIRSMGNFSRNKGINKSKSDIETEAKFASADNTDKNVKTSDDARKSIDAFLKANKQDGGYSQWEKLAKGFGILDFKGTDDEIAKLYFLILEQIKKEKESQNTPPIM